MTARSRAQDGPAGPRAHPVELSAASAGQWLPIESAPKDGTAFWGSVDDDAIRMLWHAGFDGFVSSWRRMEMAAGYTIDGASGKDHSPVYHTPKAWMPLPSPPTNTSGG